MFESPVSDLRPEAFWLVATVLMTSVLWIPYIVNRVIELGLWTAIRNPQPEKPPRAAWAMRAIRAHTNAVENLVLFAPLVVLALTTGRTSEVTAAAAGVYFYARLAHYFVYLFGLPLRTIVFAIGLGACFTIALALLGVV